MNPSSRPHLSFVFVALGAAACTGDAKQSLDGPDAATSSAPDASGPSGQEDPPSEADAGGGGAALPDRPDDNLVANAGFENGAPGAGCPGSWECVTYDPADAGAFSVTGEDARGGEQAAQWSGDVAPAAVIKQGHPAAAGREYQIAAWYRADGLSEVPYAQIMFHDASGAELDWEIFEGAADSSDWTRIVGEPVEAPPGTARVQINLSVDGTSGTVRWDDAVLVDLSEDGDLPPADYEVIPAEGQVIDIGAGEVFENKLIDLTTGQNIAISARSTNWTIRNIGIAGRKQTSGTLFGVSDSGGGTSVMENIYMADGSSRAGGQPTCPDNDCTHGPVGIFVFPEHSGHLDLRHINVQGWPNNGIYGSAPGSNSNGARGTVHIDQSYGANNYVSSFRIAGGEGNRITDSVAFNTADDYNGRPLWIWKPGPIEISGVHVDDGPFSVALEAGAHSGGTVVDLSNSQVSGPINERNGSTVNRTNVGTNPDLSIPGGVPTTPEEAAAGRAGQ